MTGKERVVPNLFWSPYTFILKLLVSESNFTAFYVPRPSFIFIKTNARSTLVQLYEYKL